MRFLPALVLPVSILLHAGCASNDADMQLEFYPTEIRLPVVHATDAVLPTVDVGLINENAVPMTISLAAVVGDIASLASISPEIVRAGRERLVDPGSVFSTQFKIGLEAAPPLRDVWRTGERSGVIRFTVSVTPGTDIATGDVDLSSEVTRTIEIPVVIPFDCDLDNDGADTEICGGNDCDDTVAGIAPSADEACDGVDNNCNDEVDEGCGPA